MYRSCTTPDLDHLRMRRRSKAWRHSSSKSFKVQIEVTRDADAPTHATRAAGGVCSAIARRHPSLAGASSDAHDFNDPLAVFAWSVEADPGEMELAIVNLCVNARDAMPAAGFITIAADNVRIEGEGAGEFVRISVSDTGSGCRKSDAGVRAFLHHQGDPQGTRVGLP